jgi:hypothetical protein
MPGAVAEFAVEMHALSSLEREPRRRCLPLRLLRDLAWNASIPVPERLWWDDETYKVPDDKLAEVEEILTAFERAWHSWHVELSHADFLEAEHSVVTNLALVLAPDARTRDNFPTLVEKLSADDRVRDGLKRLGAHRCSSTSGSSYGSRRSEAESTSARPPPRCCSGCSGVRRSKNAT